jgi:hypothetical protein
MMLKLTDWEWVRPESITSISVCDGLPGLASALAGGGELSQPHVRISKTGPNDEILLTFKTIEEAEVWASETAAKL